MLGQRPWIPKVNRLCIPELIYISILTKISIHKIFSFTSWEILQMNLSLIKVNFSDQMTVQWALITPCNRCSFYLIPSVSGGLCAEIVQRVISDLNLDFGLICFDEYMLSGVLEIDTIDNDFNEPDVSCPILYKVNNKLIVRALHIFFDKLDSQDMTVGLQHLPQ